MFLAIKPTSTSAMGPVARRNFINVNNLKGVALSAVRDDTRQIFRTPTVLNTETIRQIARNC